MLHFTDEKANLPPEFSDVIGEAFEVLGLSESEYFSNQ
jgi:hypothetical protein